MKPRNRLPESPRKIEAGWKLKQRKPTVAPARMMVTVAAPTSPFKLATTNMVVRAKSAAPAARPSRPSMRLKAFVMPTNHATVKSIPMACPRSTMPTKGNESVVTRKPAT